MVGSRAFLPPGLTAAGIKRTPFTMLLPQSVSNRNGQPHARCDFRASPSLISHLNSLTSAKQPSNFRDGAARGYGITISVKASYLTLLHRSLPGSSWHNYFAFVMAYSRPSQSHIRTARDGQRLQPLERLSSDTMCQCEQYL